MTDEQIREIADALRILAPGVKAHELLAAQFARMLEKRGLAVVPKEPTEEMISAFYVTVGEMSESETRTIDLLENGAERIYRAMLTALSQDKTK